MRYVKTTMIVGWVTVVALVAGSALAFGPMNKRTYFSFSGPIALPGITLPAGTYTFRLAESTSNRHIVQVLDRDERNVYRMLLTIPSERRELTDDPVVTFHERPADMPPPIRFWYHGGEGIGHEFVYPKDVAQRIANVSGERVPATEETATSTEELTSAEVTRVEPEPEAAEPEQRSYEQTPQPQPTPPPSTTTQEPQRPPAGTPTTPQEGRETPTPPPAGEPTLPQTASHMPLVGLGGLLALGGAVLVWVLRKSMT